jgi:pimeloyl-ACP methyl ester carboxylesterase
MFISGTFISNACWEEWIIFFEREGYKCTAPAWPYKHGSAEELRNRPEDDPIASNTISILVDYFTDILNQLPVKPILIGHSCGGLVVQLLLEKDLGAAGIVIHSFPPKRILLFRIAYLKAVWEMMILFRSTRKTYLISFRKWKRTIANGLNCHLQKELYYKYAIPESRKIIREIFRGATKINFEKVQVPLLFTAGSCDLLVPPASNYENYKKYENVKTVTDFKEFKGHNHLVFAPLIAEREARFILYWLSTLS